MPFSTSSLACYYIVDICLFKFFKMKSSLLTLLFGVICMTAPAQNSRIIGTWLGTIQEGLRLVFHFTSADGQFSATLDSPDQGATGIKCSAVVLNGDSIRVEIDVAKAVYTGKFLNDTTINGIWKQGAGTATLNFKKTNQVLALNRPQTPRQPFSYKVEDVEFENADKTVRYGGTLTLPRGGGKYAAAILISGSGQQDRDETIFEHKPFAVLADYLSNKGIVVLRVDDRGVGKTNGDATKATSADFAKDVLACLTFLQSRAEVDTKKIGLIGHSEGGMIATMIAANNKDVSFIVLWGAPAVGGAEINTEQNAYALQNGGIPHAAVNAFKQLHRQVLSSFKTAVDTTALSVKVDSIYRKWLNNQPDSIKKNLFAGEASIVGQNIRSMYSSLYNMPWMRFFINYDFAADLAKVKCKVLAINGTLDTQVDATTNLRLINSVLKANNIVQYKTVHLQGLNHLLQTATTGDHKEYGKIEETIAPAALHLLATWINENVNRKTQ